MYIHYVYNASLCVVYFISCITLCYCYTPTLNILIKLARDIISHSFLAYNTHISLLNLPSPHTNETNYVCSIAPLNHQNRPSPPFHLSLVLAATCTCCQVLATQSIQPSSTTLQLSTTSDAKTSHQRHPPQLPDFQLPDFQLTAACVASHA